MPSSGMLRLVDFIRTDVSEERNALIIRVRIGELGRTLAVIINTIHSISSQRASVASYG
jgi:hypothetical protein